MKTSLTLATLALACSLPLAALAQKTTADGIA